MQIQDNIIGIYGFIKYKNPVAKAVIASIKKKPADAFPSNLEKFSFLFLVSSKESNKKLDSAIPFITKPIAQNTFAKINSKVVFNIRTRNK